MLVWRKRVNGKALADGKTAGPVGLVLVVRINGVRCKCKRAGGRQERGKKGGMARQSCQMVQHAK